MTTRNNNSAIKKRNKTIVLRELIRAGETTKPELAASLRISLPTVGQIVEEFIEAGYVEENGRATSVGGRRPVSVRIVAGKWVALGINITAHHVGFSLVDLNGTVIDHERVKAAYERSEAYNKDILTRADAFLARNGYSREKLCGVGIALPAIISADQSGMRNSYALRLHEPTRFSSAKDFPCQARYFNDATAACLVECYADDAPESFVFLSLSNTVGGAMVIDKKLVEGDNNRCGELGHVCVMPGGRQCYCGRKGHYDAYGAAWLLAEKTGGNLAAFFERLAQGDAEFNALFEEYLDMLALLICNTIMLSDLPLIIGGYVGNYLEPYLPRLKQKVAELDLFGKEDPDIRLCRRKDEAAATGCAQYFLEQIINDP